MEKKGENEDNKKRNDRNIQIKRLLIGSNKCKNQKQKKINKKTQADQKIVSRIFLTICLRFR